MKWNPTTKLSFIHFFFSYVKQNKYHVFTLIEDTIIIAFICNFIRKIENGLITHRKNSSIIPGVYFLLILSLLEFVSGRKSIMSGFSVMYKIRLYFQVSGYLLFPQYNFIFHLSAHFLVWHVLIFKSMSFFTCHELRKA